MSVVVLGFVPEALALLGVIVSARRRIVRPMLVFALITVAAYTWWLLPQDRWALKTKYLLVLVPVGVAFAVVGQAWLARRMPVLAAATAALLVALTVVAHVYMFVFAVAR
jgi:hypothetical protein